VVLSLQKTYETRSGGRGFLLIEAKDDSTPEAMQEEVAGHLKTKGWKEFSERLLANAWLDTNAGGVEYEEEQDIAEATRGRSGGLVVVDVGSCG
jgi:hypothetical protein